jgi:N-acyl-D-aspartate/D-glutamate deacylase
MREFAAGLDGRIGVNVGLQVGHCALRRHALGDDAGTRAATEAEIATMQALLRDALDDGAVGFSSSQLDMHVDQHGNPVPSNLAAADELVALASVFADRAQGVLEFISRSNLEGHDDVDRALMLAMCEASGKPMNINPIVNLPMLGDGWKRGLEFVDEARAAGHRVHPQSQLQQMQVFFALHDTFLFDEMEEFREVLTAGDLREGMLRDPAVRDRLRAALADTAGRALVFRWDSVKVARADEHPEWVGLTVVELGAKLGVDPFDAFLDASLAEELRTTFTLGGSLGAASRRTTEEVVRHPASLPGSSDAGAHLTSYCGVDFSTRLLSEYVPDVISLEDAVRRLATIPAQLYGFVERGWIGAGAHADLVVWDPTALGVGATRWSEDFPAGGGRFVVDSTGYRALVVNGEVLRVDGVDTGARPGRVLRPGVTA